MTLKSIITEFVPPVLLKAARVFRQPRSMSEEDPSARTFSSFEDAIKNCTTSAGYEADEIVRVVFEKTKAFVKNLINQHSVEINSADAFLLLPLMNFDKNREITVIDLGGACGAHYFMYKKIVGVRAPLKWYVVETPAMCEYAKALENEELHFRDDLKETIEEAGKIDLLLTSGTLQCVDDPYSFLNLIANSSADFVLFSRLGLTLEATDVITLHKSMLSANGIGSLPEGFSDKEVEYPFSFISRQKFDMIIEKNYSREIYWNDPSGIFPVGNAPIVGLGILFRRKSILENSQVPNLNNT